MSDTITILGIDPSTSITGAAVVRYGGAGPEVLAYRAIGPFQPAGVKASDHSMRARLVRIALHRAALSGFVHNSPHAIDLVAVELPFVRGDQAGGAVHQAIGAMLTITGLQLLPITTVRTAQVKAALQQARFITKEMTRSEREAARLDSKRRMVAAANQVFGLSLDEDADAIADALAVTRAAWLLTERRSQAVLPGMKARKRPRRQENWRPGDPIG